ncbi:hypothetical protein HJFPF1_06907 [Paramyrothecium foliicola]|nr:hypothetical protein HJFPF1_06907 [Paramyrothecium foliicola]
MSDERSSFRNAAKAPAITAIIVYFFCVAVAIINTLAVETSRTESDDENHHVVEVTRIFLWYNITLFNYTYQSYRLPRVSESVKLPTPPAPESATEGTAHSRNHKGQPTGSGTPVGQERIKAARLNGYYVDIWDKKTEQWMCYYYIYPGTCDTKSPFSPPPKGKGRGGPWEVEAKSPRQFKHFSSSLATMRSVYKGAHPNAHVQIVAVEKLFKDTLGVNGLIGGVLDLVHAAALFTTMATHGAVAKAWSAVYNAATNLIDAKQGA